jgi:hypothetical protein
MDLPITNPFHPEYSEYLAERTQKIKLSFEKDNAVATQDPACNGHTHLDRMNTI